MWNIANLSHYANQIRWGSLSVLTRKKNCNSFWVISWEDEIALKGELLNNNTVREQDCFWLYVQMCKYALK